MLAIIEKWKPMTHGYSIPPDNHQCIKIMKNYHLVLIRWNMNDIDQQYSGSIDFLNDYIQCVNTLQNNYMAYF